MERRVGTRRYPSVITDVRRIPANRSAPIPSALIPSALIPSALISAPRHLRLPIPSALF